MSSIFDLGEKKITREYCESIGMWPMVSGREYIKRHSGTTKNGERFWSSFVYRRRNPHAPKNEPKHDYVKFNIHIYKNCKREVISRVYRDIKYEVDLIACARNIGDEFGIQIF